MIWFCIGVEEYYPSILGCTSSGNKRDEKGSHGANNGIENELILLDPKREIQIGSVANGSGQGFQMTWTSAINKVEKIVSN